MGRRPSRRMAPKGESSGSYDFLFITEPSVRPLRDPRVLCLLTSGSMAALLNPGSTRDQIPEEALLHLASEGIDLRNALFRWSETFAAWRNLDSTHKEDARSTLANIYFHAISIYLSGLYDYRYQFNQILSASLPSDNIQIHVCEILHHTEDAMKTTRLAGILFFFPLRVAGARARTSAQRSAILSMLDRITERSFVVAQAFSQVLKSLWGDKAL